MNLQELNFKKELLQRELRRLESIETGCHQCDHFANSKCMKFDATPPPEFRKAGCEEWQWDGVPF